VNYYKELVVESSVEVMGYNVIDEYLCYTFKSSW